jgi:outer membrane lipoprotein-sorting protein
MKSLIRFYRRTGGLFAALRNSEVGAKGLSPCSWSRNARAPESFRFTDDVAADHSAESARYFLRTFLLIITTAIIGPVVLGMGGCAGNNSFQNTNIDGLIDSLEKRSYLVKQFRAEFVKTRRSAVFKRDLSVRGRLVFQRPNSFLLTMNGDANLEILSDGENISLTHDDRDREVYRVQGERDLSKFTDPLMTVIQGIGDGAIRRFTLTQTVKENGLTVLELEPNGQANFERIEKVVVVITGPGEIRRVSVYFKDGDNDETTFESWTLLAQDDPEILDLKNRLKRLSRTSQPALLKTSKISDRSFSGLTPRVFEVLATNSGIDHQR